MDMQSRKTAKETQANANSGEEQSAIWPFDPYDRSWRMYVPC